MAEPVSDHHGYLEVRVNGVVFDDDAGVGINTHLTSKRNIECDFHTPSNIFEYHLILYLTVTFACYIYCTNTFL